MKTASALVLALIVALGCNLQLRAQGVIVETNPAKKTTKAIKKKIEARIVEPGKKGQIVLQGQDGETKIIELEDMDGARWVDLGDGQKAMIMIETMDSDEDCGACELETAKPTLKLRAHMPDHELKSHMIVIDEDGDGDEGQIECDLEGLDELAPMIGRIMKHVDVDKLAPMLGQIIEVPEADVRAFHDGIVHHLGQAHGHGPIETIIRKKMEAATDCPPCKCECPCCAAGKCGPREQAAMPGLPGVAQRRIIARRLDGETGKPYQGPVAPLPLRSFAIKQDDGGRRRIRVQDLNGGPEALAIPVPTPARPEVDLGELEQRIERLGREMNALQKELRALRRKI